MRIVKSITKTGVRIILTGLLMTPPLAGSAQLLCHPTGTSGRLYYAIYDYTTEGRIYATNSSQLLVSENAGKNWRVAFTNPEPGIITKLKSYDNSDVVYFAINKATEPDVPGIYRLDHKTGEVKHLKTPNQQMIPQVMSYDVADGGRVIVAYTTYTNAQTLEYRSEVYLSTDSGDTWELIYDYKDHNYIHPSNVAFKPGNIETIYLTRGSGPSGSDGGILISHDSGKSWSERLAGVTLGPIAINPSDPSKMILGGTDRNNEAIYLSDDAGETWRMKNDFNWTPGLLEGIRDVSYDPADPNRVYVFDSNQVFLTTDGFNTHAEITPQAYCYGFYTSFNPFNTFEMLIGNCPNYSTDQVAHTIDGLQSIEALGDPTNGVDVGGAVGGIAPTADGKYYYLENGFLVEKDSNGTTVKELGAKGYDRLLGDPAGNSRLLLLNTGAGTMAVADMSGNGVITPLATKAGRASAMAFDPSASGTCLIVMDGKIYKGDFSDPAKATMQPLGTNGVEGEITGVCFNKPGNCLIAAGGKIYASSNGGGSWTRLSNGIGNASVQSVTSSPLNGNLLIATNKSEAYISTDSGNTWTKTSLAANGLCDVTFSPTVQGVIAAAAYAPGMPASIHFSTDNGASWRTISARELHYSHASASAFMFAADGKSITAHIASPDMGRLSYDIALQAPTMIETFPWVESFEQGGLPSNWNMTTTGGGQWNAVEKNDGTPSGTPDQSEMKLRFNGQNASSSSRLTTPRLDLTKARNAAITFSYSAVGGASLRIFVQNGDQTWQEMTFTPACDSRWHTITLPLTTREVCRIAFEASGSSEVQLDNVKVHAIAPQELKEVRVLEAAISYGPVAELTWTAPEGAYNSSYNVYRDNVKIAGPISDNTYIDNGFTTGKHTWTVKTIYDGAESAGAIVEATYTGQFSPVSNAAVDIHNNTSGDAIVSLTWELPDSYDKGIYNIYRDGNAIASGVTDVVYTDYGLTNGTHQWSIAAVYGDKESEKVSVSAEVTNFSSPVRYLASSFDVAKQSVKLSWKEPGGLPDNYICHSGEPVKPIGYPQAGQFRMTIAVRWSAKELQEMGLDGAKLTKLALVPWSQKASYYPRVYVGGDGKKAGNEQYVNSVKHGTELDLQQWNTIEFQNPVTIDANQELWIGYQVLFTGPDDIIGCDDGPEIPGINMITDGVNWYTASEFDPEYKTNFCIGGCFETADGNKIIKRSKKGTEWTYDVYRGDKFLTNTDKTTFEESGLPEADYTYSVTAIHPVKGKSVPRTTTLFAGNQCPEVENLAAEVNEVTGDVTLSWDAADPYYVDEVVAGETFDNGIPQTWTQGDRDGDGVCWVQSNEPNTSYMGIPSPLSGECIVSASKNWDRSDFLNPTFTLADNWIISPAIELPQLDTELTYHVAQLYNFSHSTKYEVLISTTGTDYDDFTLLFDEELGQTSTLQWLERNIDLSEYSGKTVYIAFRNYCDDEKAITEGIQIDEFAVKASAPVERKYNVYRDGELIAPSMTGTSFTDSSEAGKAHVYTVRTLCEDLGYESHPSETTTEGSGIESVTAGELRLYPNPATDHINVESVNGLGRVSIADLNGRIVFSTDFGSAASATIEVSYLSTGLYIITTDDTNAYFIKR